MSTLDERYHDPAAPEAVIVCHPGTCGGAPVLAGTRIGVHHVVSYAQAYHQDLERVHREALPHLTMEQIHVAMAWYEEHREEIDEILRQHRESYERGLAAARSVR